MKILITGKNGYVATRLISYLQQEKWNNRYEVTGISLRNDDWRRMDFSIYDVIVHTAGIAHVDIASEQSAQYEQQKKEYDRVNHLLTVEVARKAKESNVKQFIFLSSIIVYGESAPAGQDKLIGSKTATAPVNFYGESKLLAEQEVALLAEERFIVSMLRLPMVYGTNCKGNFRLLQKAAKVLPVFPKSTGSRSMIYIDNLCECIRLITEHSLSGLFCPQNREYVNTAELMKQLRNANGKKLLILPGFQWILSLLGSGKGKLSVIVNKVFGSLRYETEFSSLPEGLDYQIVSLEESVRSICKSL